jgi:hypothetical protein
VSFASAKPVEVGHREPSGRGRAALMVDWHPRRLPAETVITPVTLVAADGEVSRGILYEASERADTVVTLMHPRQDLHRAPQVPDLLEAGFAVWTHNNRDVNNDLRLVHERVLLDIAAGMEWLRERGFARIVPLGISGGAALAAFYTEQALLSPERRIDREPSGRPAALREATMPAPDALALLAPHPGQGRLLERMIDPSLVDESDPLSLDPTLDPYDPANGFGPAPDGSSYSPEFVTRYRAAQRDRVGRIDARARDLLERGRRGRRRWKEGKDVAGLRQSLALPVLTTYRTDADLRCTDLGLEPTDRAYGSIISARPNVSNYGPIGFGRLTTPEAWLSTWSGISSNAGLERCARGVDIPTLVIEYTGDQAVFPSDVESLLGALGEAETTHVRVRGTHFGESLDQDAEPAGEIAMDHLAEWLGRGRVSG